MSEAPPPRRKAKKKEPQQARSRQLKADLLDGATRVLETDGAERFTTNRVADATGVSIGSLYQYYPDKQALLLDLHERDSELLWQKLALVLNDAEHPARDRFELVIRSSFEAQAAAAEHHSALRNAPRITDTAAFQRLAAAVTQELEAFLRDALPSRRDESHFLASFCFTVVSGALEQLATNPVPPVQARRVADEVARMLANHLGL